jgi:peptidyl-prolyl cis-trans isomerase SurA
MKKSGLLILILISGFALNAQKKSKVLLTIDDTPVTTDEFIRIYEKNSGMNTEDEKSVREYLDLFINFKLKVIEAENLGYDEDEDFKRELTGYEIELAKPYLSGSNNTEEMVKEAYERSQYYVNASHILFRVNKNALPDDTLAAYNKAMEYRKRILAGEDFGKVAKEINIDRRGRSNDGNLGWFTYKQMVYPFETAAYNTPIGEVSMPVKTEYGYHLILVHDKVKNPGSIKVAHIMIAIPPRASDSLIQEKKKQIDKCYKELQNGASFEDLVKKYSEHEASKEENGVIKTYLHFGSAPEEFLEAGFALEKPGDISKPVLTKYGWHIIKLIDKRSPEDFETMKPKLEKDVTSDSRRKRASEKTILNNIKKKYGFSENIENLKPLLEVADSSVLKGTWNASVAADLNNVLFTIGTKSYTDKDLADFLEIVDPPTLRKSIEEFVYQVYLKFQSDKIKEYAVKMLEKENREFALIVKEYHDGILLFNLTNDMVWNKAIEDSTGLAEFYKENKDKYLWGDRVLTAIYAVRDSLTIPKVLDIAGDRVEKGYDQEQLRELICDTTDTKCVILSEKKFEKGDYPEVDSMKWEKGEYTIEERGRHRYYIYYIEDILPSCPKTFEEAKGLYTADYQNYLEQEWIKELRKKHTVTVNEKVLSKLEKNYQ